MKIPLDLISPSPHPVRTQWDEDKMEQLTQSVKKHGVIVPIKVRPNFDNGSTLWAIVYGHRRVEASKRAGLEEIPAIKDAISIKQADIEALIENIQRDNLTDIEMSHAFNELKDEKGKPLSAEKVAKLVGLSVTRVKTIMALTDKYVDIADAFVNEITNRHLSDDLRKTSQSPPGKVIRDMATKAQFIDQYIKDDVPLRQSVAKKVVRENLSQQKTAKVAKAISNTKDEAEREAILETEYEQAVSMPAFVRAKAEAKRKVKKQERKKREEDPREVAKYYEALRVFRGEVEEAIAVAKFGKFSPEAAQFTITKHDALRQLLTALEEAQKG